MGKEIFQPDYMSVYQSCMKLVIVSIDGNEPLHQVMEKYFNFGIVLPPNKDGVMYIQNMVRENFGVLTLMGLKNRGYLRTITIFG